MKNNHPHQLSFETNLNWLSEDRGIVYAKGCNGTIHVSTPEEFGGLSKDWSPEHLLLGAVTSCYMATFAGFAKKANLPFRHLECRAIGQVEIKEGRYKFTYIDVYSRISVDDDLHFETANAVSQKTQHYCLVSNSINAVFNYHTEIVRDLHPAHSSTTAIVC